MTRTQRNGRVEGRRWYGFVYRAAYFLGLRIWDRGEPAPGVVDLVEGQSASAPGRALDIGCGTGTDSVYLAEHGWKVTGVDMVPKALAIARRKAAAAGVSPRFVQADATRLGDFGIGEGYDLLLDFGCFHTLPPDRRDAYVEGVSRAAAPGATFLLFGFTRPPRLSPMRSGLTTEEVRERFDGGRWELVDAERKSAGPIEVAGRRAADLFELWGYRLRRLAVA
jgi:SAM-dependent methyltransferase